VLLQDNYHEPEVLAGQIVLNVYKDGRVEFSFTGVFKDSPSLLADLLERLPPPK
jgi:hypothetical protein